MLVKNKIFGTFFGTKRAAEHFSNPFRQLFLLFKFLKATSLYPVLFDD